MTTALRPLGLGELLDRSFFLYRKHFALFVGIHALPYLLLLAFQLTGVAIGTTRGGMFSGLFFIWTFGSLIIQLGVTAASQGATVVAVSNVHLDREATISSAFAGIKGRILSISLLMIGVGIGTVLGFILLIIPGIILALMWALVIPVAVLEDTGLGDSISRSSELTKGSRLRILVIYILYFFLVITITWLWEIPMFAVIGVFARQGHNAAMVPLWSQIVIPICNFLSLSLVTPLITIALSLTYYDQKVRKEAFDLQHMMAALDSAPGDAATALPG
jgi:hypothetical protein